MIPTLLGVAVLIFFLMRVVPGDLVELRFAGESAFAQKENLDTERARLGLDQPLWKQFLVWIAGVVRLGIVFILGLLIVFKWLPPMVYTPFWVNPWQNMLQLIWPALAVGYRYSAVATRMTRSAMLEVLREDYIRTARAKGLWEQLILSRHALKNAMLPVLTVIALEFAFLMGGLVVTEQVFNLNGLGMLFVESVARRDYTLTQALVMLTASAFIVVNFLMDVMYAWLDPRIRY